CGCLEAPPGAPAIDGGPDDELDAGEEVGFTPARSLGGYRHHFCAVGSIGKVACWGDVDFEYPRDIAGAGSPSPRGILTTEGTPLTGALEVAVGETFACALLQDGG